jgi:hypothetical protein
MIRLYYRSLALFTATLALTIASKAAPIPCGAVSITFAQIGTAASKQTLAETFAEGCITITVTDRTFTTDPVTYEMVGPDSISSDFMVLSNNMANQAVFCFESDLEDMSGASRCTQVGTNIKKFTELLDIPILDTTTGTTYYAFLDSDPFAGNASDLVGLSLTPMPEPGTFALVGTVLLTIATSVLRRRKARIIAKAHRS